MTQIPATELNRRPSTYLDLAAAGEVIEITKRGTVIAVLGPPRSDVRPTITKPVQTIDTRDAQPRVMPPTKPDPDRVRAAGPQRIGLSKKEQAGGRYDR